MGSSFPRKRESRATTIHRPWTPAFAGVTGLSGVGLGRSKIFGAAVAQPLRRGEEVGGEIEGGGRRLHDEPAAALAGDIGEALGYIDWAGVDDGLYPGADRALGGAGVIAAIEQRRRFRPRHRGPGRRDQLAPPNGAAMDAGSRRACQDDGSAGFRRRGQRRDGVRQGVDDDDGRVRGAG
jgi:hypothetical protein